MSAGVPCASSHTALFRRCRSEYTVLYRTVQGHLATWLERSSDSQQGGSVGRPTSSANFAAPSNVASWPMTAPVPAPDHADTAFRLPALAFLPRSASVFCGRSPGANCSSAKTCKPWVPGNTAGASRSMPAYASKQTIAGGWSLCCGTAPGRPSRWNDYGKSLTGTGSMRASGRAWGEHPPDAHAARSLGGPDSATNAGIGSAVSGYWHPMHRCARRSRRWRALGPKRRQRRPRPWRPAHRQPPRRGHPPRPLKPSSPGNACTILALRFR